MSEGVITLVEVKPCASSLPGASGHIGSALIPELLQAGHQVVGLARSDESAATLTRLGAEVSRGDLDDLDALRKAASAADGVIHLAFKHEAMRSGDYESAVVADLLAIGAIGDTLAGTGKSFVGTSGTLMLAFGGLTRTGTEADTFKSGPRIDAENTVIGLAESGVRSSVVRLPPIVHSELDHHGFLPTLIAIARDQGRRLPGRGRQSLAERSHPRRRAPVPARSGEGAGRHPAARGRRRGHPVPRDRRIDRPSPELAYHQRRTRGRCRLLQLPRVLREPGQPDLEHDHARTAWLAADASRSYRGHGQGSLFRERSVAGTDAASWCRGLAATMAPWLRLPA